MPLVTLPGVSRVGGPLAAVALAVLMACGQEDGEDTTPHTVPGAAPGAVAPAAPGIPTPPPASTHPTAPAPVPPAAASGCDGFSVSAVTEPERLDAMVVVQTVVLTWDPDLPHAAILSAPPAAAVGKALDTLRCDGGLRAVSRHARAVAKFLGMDWKLLRARPYLIRLGFPDSDAIDAFKARVVAQIGLPAFAVHGHDPRWVEYAVTRRLTTKELPPGRVAALEPGLFGPAVAYAQGTPPPSCWQPEASWDFEHNGTSVNVGGHVSVVIDPANPPPLEQGLVQQHVDPQEWDACGRFWSPPNPSNPSGPPLDGARFVKSQWTSTGPCTKPTEPFDRPDIIPEAGTPYDTHYLHEQFFVRTLLGDAWFQNILSIQARSTTHEFQTGISVPAHQIDYALGLCGTLDNVDGAMGGGIYGTATKTILDWGNIEVWSDGFRTHVKAFKTFEFDGAVLNWLTQFNPELRELNEQLGELACCL